MGLLVSLVEVEVEVLEADSPLLGASVDSPTAGRTMAAAALEIGGWALAREGRPDAVEVALGDQVLAEGAWRRREDLASAFPDVEAAPAAGFEAVVDASSVPAEAVLEVRARLGHKTVPFAWVHLRSHWRGELDPGSPPLISIVVLGEPAGEREIQRTLQGIGLQRHPLTEVLVLRSPGPGTAMPAAREESGVREIAGGLDRPSLRNEGIRQSNGDLILFVEGGSLLAPDALPLGLEMLVRRPDAVAVIDGDDDTVAAALYRRSGFEELEGFAEVAEGDCDLELAARAKRFGALLAPGALVAGGR